MELLIKLEGQLLISWQTTNILVEMILIGVQACIPKWFCFNWAERKTVFLVVPKMLLARTSFYDFNNHAILRVSITNTHS